MVLDVASLAMGVTVPVGVRDGRDWLYGPDTPCAETRRLQLCGGGTYSDTCCRKITANEFQLTYR